MSLLSLWLPIVVSAAGVWIASAIVWMALPHHKKDFAGLPNEDAARKALGTLRPGQYNIPHCKDWNELKDPEVSKKFAEGPIGFLTVLPNGVPNMARAMGLSFVFNLVVGVAVAYLASRVLAADAAYLSVFRVVGTTTFLAYGFGVVPDAIWFGRPWSSVVKNFLDSALYALVTAGVFAALW